MNMAINDRVSQFKRVRLALLPTPFYKLENISRDLDCMLYCKRDDLTGFAFGGNKVRKMEYLLADARSLQTDTIVTVGAYQSNFCRVTAAAGVYAGMEVHLVLGGKDEPRETGNYLLDKLLGAHLHPVRSDDWADWESERRQVAEQLRTQGKRVYEMPIGGSTATGAIGYVSAFLELMDDCNKSGVVPDHIYFASSSGGTHAGLLTGKNITGWQGRITGIGVAKSGGVLSNEVFALAVETATLCDIRVNNADVIVDGSYMGPAYGIPTDETIRAIEYFAQKEGIFLDRVYSGKAAAGLLDHIRSGRVNRGESIVFVHTGGNVELFA
jgi:L-cysteate sulfo-lyase